MTAFTVLRGVWRDLHDDRDEDGYEGKRERESRGRERERVGEWSEVPGVDILRGRENRLAGLLLILQKPLQLQEFLAQHLVF